MNKRTKSGFTLIEMLVAIAVIVLLIIGIGAGVNAGLKAYKESIFESNCGTLSEILNTTIGNALRYSEDVSGENSSFTFTNYDYNVKACYFTIKDIDNRSGGYVYMTNGVTGEKAINVPIVNDGAYADDLMVTSLVITSHKSDNGGYYFDIAYTITSISDSNLSHDYTLRVRQANADVQYVIDINSGSDTPGGSEGGGGGDSPTVDAESITIVYDSNVPTDVNDRFVFTDVFGNKTRSVTQVMDPKVSTTFRTFSADKASCSWYELTSWKDDAGHVYLPGSDATLEEAEITRINSQEGGTLTLYAQWSPATYTIIYDNNGGSGSKTQTFTKADKTVTLYSNNSSVYDEKITNSGHEVTFIGNSGTVEGKDTHKITAQCELLKWTAGGTEYSLGQTLTIADGFITGFDPKVKEITLSAKWSKAYITMPTAEKKSSWNDKWTFNGWSTESFAKTGLKAGEKVEITGKGVKYTAQYSHRVTFYKNPNNDGTTAYNTQTYYYGGDAVVIPATDPTIDGYSFLGWYTNKDEGKGDAVTTSLAATNFVKNTVVNFYAHWDVGTYTINFEGNGSTNKTSYKKENIKYNQNVTLNNEFTRSYSITYDTNGGSVSPASSTEAWTFSNWTCSNGNTYNNNQQVSKLTSTDKGTVTMTANWTAGTVTLPTPSKGTAWSFKGWKSGNTTYNAASSYSFGANTTLTAQWECTVTFDANGGKFADNTTSKGVTYKYGGTSISIPSTPVNPGYTFDGWYTAKTGGVKKSSPTEVTDYVKANGNTTLYAHYDAKQITISFNGNGATSESIGLSPIKAPYDGTFTTSKYQTAKYEYYFVKIYPITHNYIIGSTTNTLAITKESYRRALWKLDGYSTVANGGTVLALNTTYDVSEVSNGGDVTLYAHWESDSGSIRYPNKTDGSFDASVFNTWNLEGWSDSPKTKTPNKDASGNIRTAEKITSARTYYAVLSRTVTLNANGGTLQSGSSPIKYYSWESAPSITAEPTRTGYEFDGWYTAANGGTKVTNAGNASYDSNGSATIYAHWKASYKYVITFDGGDNGDTTYKTHDTPGTNDSDWQSGKTSYTAYFDLPTRPGYTFAGWDYTASPSTATVTVASNNKSCTVTGVAGTTVNVTMKAKWKSNGEVIVNIRNTGYTLSYKIADSTTAVSVTPSLHDTERVTVLKGASITVNFTSISKYTLKTVYNDGSEHSISSGAVIPVNNNMTVAILGYYSSTNDGWSFNDIDGKNYLYLHNYGFYEVKAIRHAHSLSYYYRCWLYFDVGTSRYYLKGNETILATSQSNPTYDGKNGTYPYRASNNSKIDCVEKEYKTIWTGTLYKQ